MFVTEYGEALIQYDKPDNLVNLLEDSVEKFPNNNIIGTKNQQGEYEWVSYAEFGQRVDNLRAGLAQMGVGKDDTVGIISTNRLEWAIIAFATYGVEGRIVPMYEKELEKTWKYIVKDAGIKALFISTQEIFTKFKNLSDEFPSLERIILMEGTGKDSMSEIEKLGQKTPIDSKKPDPNHIASLIYTSGTVGEPKGVLLSHGNITSNSQAGWKFFQDINDTSRALSILPWAHSYAQTAELFTFIRQGASIALATVKTMADDLTKANPTHLMCVPRLFNTIYDKIQAGAVEEGGMKKKLFDSACNAARIKRETGRAGLKYKFLNKIVFGKLRAKFGTQLKVSLTASAKTSPKIVDFFYDIGLPIYDCYGLTETSPALTMSSKEFRRSGSVGKVIEKVKIVIDQSIVEEGADDGEIVAFGPNVMQGYHNKPEETKKIMIEENGIKGIRTGDRGRLDEDGFLYITGRIKQAYKLVNGKYIHPEAIEQEIKLMPLVTNVMLYGDGKEYNTALVIPDMDVVKRHAKELELTIDAEDLIQIESIQKLLGKEIQAHLVGKFASYEIPRKFAYITQDFTLENGSLTQTMKLKRKTVLKEYEETLKQLYQEHKPISHSQV